MPTKKKNSSLPDWLGKYINVKALPKGVTYDAEKAERPIRFAEKVLVHLKGEWAGRPIILEEWEKEIIRVAFGLIRADGFRLIRVIYLEIPRKNGKSLIATALGAYMTFSDGEPGAEIYSAGASQDQANIIFKQAQTMIKRSPALSKRATVNKERIVYKDSFWVALAADASTLDGLNPHCILFDELHAQKNRRLYDVLHTAVGARRQPMEIYITTAGEDEESICYELRDHALKVKSGVLVDPAFLGVIYAADKDDDPGDPRVWAKANPNLGVTVKLDYIERQYQEALAKPSYMNTFKRLHLNIWTRESQVLIPPHIWKKCKRDYKFEDLSGICYLGVDLSRAVDITAVAAAFPDEDYRRIRTHVHCFLPREAALEKEKIDNVPYLTWAEQGFLTLTPGEVVDYDAVEEYIDMMMKRFDVPEVAFDPWGSTQISTRLHKLGAEVADFRQGFRTFSPVLKDMEALLVSRQIHHNDNLMLNWMVSNLRGATDAAGNLKPDKATSKKRIDGIVALIMAIGRALVYRPDDGSIYDSRGIITL